jgi:anaerobic C4-dicarboxylate transporter
MPNTDPAIEIPAQPVPEVLDSALEKDEVANLDEDLGTYQRKARETSLQKKEHELEVERVMLKQRKRYAILLFGLSAVWLIFIGAFLVFAGIEKLKVADSVLIALVSTTTANVLGLFYIVARWLFPNKNIESRSKGEPNDSST